MDAVVVLLVLLVALEHRLQALASGQRAQVVRPQ